MNELARSLLALIQERGQTIAVAESCTGGFLANVLTNVPGASKSFVGGIVAYSERAKEALLDVSVEAMARESAVSSVVAQAMARGVVDRFSAVLGIAVVGYAGPEGAPDGRHQVGTVFVALAGSVEAVKEYMFLGSRKEVKRQAATAALSLALEKMNSTPPHSGSEGG